MGSDWPENDKMVQAYDAYLLYVNWRYRHPHASLTTQALEQHRFVSLAGLDVQQKSWVDAWVWQFEKHGSKATKEAERTDSAPLWGRSDLPPAA